MNECGHALIQSCGICELCDVDWLIANGEGDAVENPESREEIVEALCEQDVREKYGVTKEALP